MIQLLRRKFTIAEYYQMGEVGIIGPDDRTELVEGEVVQMPPIGFPHSFSVRMLLNHFSQVPGGRVVLDSQNPSHLDEHSEVQPDLMLLRLPVSRYAARHPGPEDALLVVEVSQTTLAYDREVKIPLYARHGVPEAWLVDLAAGTIEVYRQPEPEGYRQMTIHRRGQQVAPLPFPEGGLAVAEVLGPEPQN